MATTTVAIGTMKVAQVSKPGADFQIVDRNIPARKGGRGLRPDDERQGRISRRSDNVMLAFVFTVMHASQCQHFVER
jgi:hypothetical protein